MSGRQSHNFAAGFTLIELIVAMLMTSILAFSLYASLNTAYKAKASAERAIAPIHAASFAADIITRDFDSIVQPSTLSIGSMSYPCNSGGLQGQGSGYLNYLCGALTGIHQSGGAGSSDQVEIFCNGDDGTDDGTPFSAGIRRVDYELRSNGNSFDLIRRVTRNLLSPMLDAGGTQPDEEVICRNVQSLSLQYYDGTSFYDDWDPTQFDMTNVSTTGTAVYLPVLVKLQIVVTINDPTLPPDQADKPGANSYSVSRTILLPAAQPVPQ